MFRMVDYYVCFKYSTDGALDQFDMVWKLKSLALCHGPEDILALVFQRLVLRVIPQQFSNFLIWMKLFFTL